MGKHGKNSKPRMTTIVLAAVLVMLAGYFLARYAFYPMYMHSRLIKLDYEVYGGMTDELKDSELFEDMKSGKSFCFAGDSITKGNAINGIHWYEPLLPFVSGKVSNFSHGGWTVKDLLKNKNRLPSSDIYVIAIGLNDVIHPNSKKAASTPDDYKDSMNQLTKAVLKVSPNAKIYLIAPWALPGWGDATSKRSSQFREALKDLCDEMGFIYLNPEPVIISKINESGSTRFMKDGCHPNAPEGVGLYSYAVLLADHGRRAMSVS